MKILQTRGFRGALAAAALLLAFVAGLSLRTDSRPAAGDGAGASAAEAATTWTCSMHPQIQLPEPGSCPLCGMDLIPVESAGESDAGPTRLTLGESARKLAEIRTARAERREVSVEIRLVGKLEADETRVRDITAWVPGRIDRLHVDFTGVSIRAGEPLFDLYSPELISAQEELLQARAAAERLRGSDLESTRLSAERTVEAARERLRLWGLTEDQISGIATRGRANEHVTFFAPTGGVVLAKRAVEGEYVRTGTPVYTLADLSRLWLRLDAYESDVARLAVGQPVEFSAEAYPGESFRGTVAFVDPVLTEKTRTVKVRVDVENPDGRLRPGMFARAVVRSEVPRDEDGPPLVIPETAPLVTGKRAVVYVADASRPGSYAGREIVLGPKAGDVYVVREGLDEGELVVVHGAFKIDSALQIQAKRSMMSADDASEAGEAPLADVPAGILRRLDSVLSAYYAVGDALSHDDHARARRAASQLAEALSETGSTSFPPEAARAWRRSREILAKAGSDLAASSDIDSARRAFDDLSRSLIGAVRRFGASGRVPALVFHCPMAMDSRGADWMQPSPGTENPYYGSQMFTCGSQTEVLVAADESAERGER
jgi:Cu(I)/Ag(I) efflux system membrane fusion protein